MGLLPVAAEPMRGSCSSPPSPTLPLPKRPKHRDSLSLILLHLPNPSLHQLKQIQAQLFHQSLHHDTVLITKLIASCASAGATNYAARLFHSLPHPDLDLVLCNSMLKAYTLNSLPHLAVSFYVDQLLSRGFSPDRFTFPYILKASAALSSLNLGRQVHASLVKNPNTCGDVIVLNSLLDMYFKCCRSESAVRVFHRMEEPNSTSWNMMMSGLVNSGDWDSALALFDDMPQRDVVSWNTLMGAYVKAGEMDVAQDLFDKMHERDSVSWNVLISGYSQNGESDKALAVFYQMLAAGIKPDNATLLAVASACSIACSVESKVVDQIASFAKSANSVSVSTALLSLYAKVGRMEEAREVFDAIPEKDLVAWNAMITGYAQNQRPAEAIELFRLMQRSKNGVKIRPDSVTMLSLIDSCSQLGALSLGKWVEAYCIRKNRMVETTTVLMTALVDMYAKCGDLDRARRLFTEIPGKDLASWNAMIKGLAIHGQANEALELFHLMEEYGIVPNDVTFVGLLSACSHGGLVARGLELFELMQQSRYSIAPCIELYGCVIDLLGRAGRLVEAYELVKNMPVEPDAVVWGALLGACRSHQNLELAEVAAQRLAELEPGHDGNFVLLSNVYASMGKWGNVDKVRARMRALQVQKVPGCSAVELGGMVHEFSAGDRSHPRSNEIYGAWDELVKQLKILKGYEPDRGSLLKNLDEEEDKEEALYRHSEKLALSFAIISSESRSPIRIIKNLRICNDCHRVMELVSELQEREITVRDRIRFHHFSAGRCSCGGYW